MGRWAGKGAAARVPLFGYPEFEALINTLSWFKRRPQLPGCIPLELPRRFSPGPLLIDTLDEKVGLKQAQGGHQSPKSAGETRHQSRFAS